MTKKIIHLIGVKKDFVRVFDAPSRCNSAVGFRLSADGEFLAKGVASVQESLYKFWSHSLANVFGKVDGLDKDIIINLYDANKFKSTLNYFGAEFDMSLSCEFDTTYNAYIAKKITVSNPTLKIDFACLELILGWTEYTQQLLTEKSTIAPEHVVADFTFDSATLNNILRLCGIGTFSSDDDTLNIKCENGNLIAYNLNFSQIVKTGFDTNFERISIKSSLLSKLDTAKSWTAKVGKLPSGGTKWVLIEESGLVTVVVGGIVHDDDNINVDAGAIDEAFASEFGKYMEG